MEFALSSEQAQLAASLAKAFAAAAAPAAVMAFADGAAGVEEDLVGLARDLGLPGLIVAEGDGGLGLGLLDAALLAEAVGRAAAPLPYAASYVLAPLALSAAGASPAAASWLRRLAAGTASAAVALRPLGRAGLLPPGFEIANGAVSGEALFVEGAAGADLIILEDAEGGLRLVETASGGVEARPARTLDRTRRFFDLSFRDAVSIPLAAAPGTADRLRSVSGLLLAAESLGAAEAMLSRAVDYAGVRTQFGRLIGSFQAVKHLCAEMAAEIEPSRALVWYAAAALDDDLPDGALAAAHAKAHLSEVGRFVARTATEVHGGVGFTDALGLHLWFKRIEANRQIGGAPEAVRRLAARLTLGA